MTELPARSTIWSAANLAGVGIYLCLASAVWPESEEAAKHFNPANGFYWVPVVLPLLVSFLALNLCALVAIARRGKSRRNRIAAWKWVAISALWLCAGVYDTFRTSHFDNVTAMVPDESVGWPPCRFAKT